MSCYLYSVAEYFLHSTLRTVLGETIAYGGQAQLLLWLLGSETLCTVAVCLISTLNAPSSRPAEHQSPLQRSALDAQPRGALPPAAAATTLQIHRELEKQLIESTARAIEMQKRIDTLEAQSQASTRLEQQYLARIAELEGKAASAREDATRSDSKLRRLLRAQIRTQRFAEEHRRCESKLRKLVDELREDGAPGSTGLEDDTQAIAPPGSPAEGQWHPVIIQNGGPSPDGLMNSNRGQ
eukprot:jgi/Chlat1/4727/Chrsp30S04751